MFFLPAMRAILHDRQQALLSGPGELPQSPVRGVGYRRAHGTVLRTTTLPDMTTILPHFLYQ